MYPYALKFYKPAPVLRLSYQLACYINQLKPNWCLTEGSASAKLTGIL